MHFSKSPHGSKSAITMRPASVELTLMLFLFIKNFLGLKYIKTKKRREKDFRR